MNLRSPVAQPARPKSWPGKRRAGPASAWDGRLNQSPGCRTCASLPTTHSRSHILVRSPTATIAANPMRIEIVKSRMTSFATCRCGPLNMSIRLSARLIVAASERSCRAGLYGYQGGRLPILMGHLHETRPTCRRVSPSS